MQPLGKLVAFIFQILIDLPNGLAYHIPKQNFVKSWHLQAFK